MSLFTQGSLVHGVWNYPIRLAGFICTQFLSNFTLQIKDCGVQSFRRKFHLHLIVVNRVKIFPLKDSYLLY